MSQNQSPYPHDIEVTQTFKITEGGKISFTPTETNTLVSIQTIPYTFEYAETAYSAWKRDTITTRCVLHGHSV